MKPEESSAHGDFHSGLRIASEVGAETEQFFRLEEVDRRRHSVSFAGDRISREIYRDISSERP